ncbi:MAG: Ig-like domain-containing protein, partial [Anaerovoracaceae bacterium]|nr:Ig-like domain-containing protein [Anaerovoracaceae bacterium]
MIRYGNAYYLDVTENDFLMTGGFAEEADKGFAGITKDPTDSTFEYRSASESEDSGLTATNLRECYSEKCDDWSEGSFRITYADWEDEEHADAEPQKLERPVVIAPMEVNVYLSDAITLKVGGSYQLDPILDIHVPAKFTYESEDENIATVSKDGVIKGVSEGETIITIHAKQEDPDPNYADADDMDIWIKVVPKDSSEDAAERMDDVHDKLAQVLQMLADALIKQN